MSESSNDFETLLMVLVVRVPHRSWVCVEATPFTDPGYAIVGIDLVRGETVAYPIEQHRVHHLDMSRSGLCRKSAQEVSPEYFENRRSKLERFMLYFGG